MKKLSLLIILLGLSLFANAIDQSLGSACLEMKKVARIAMSARQSGKEFNEILPDTLEALKKQSDGDLNKYERAAKIATNIIERAYKIPLYESEYKKSKAITQFGNEIKDLCSAEPESIYLKKQ